MSVRMKFIAALALAAFLVLPPLAAAQEPSPQSQQQGPALAIGLADSRVAITTGFNGARLTLFGVKNEPGELAVVVRGPERDMVVRHKDKVMGVWMNRESVRFRGVPSYYDFAVGGSENDLAPADVRRQLGIGLDGLSIAPVGRGEAETAGRFREALIRNKQAQGLFPLSPENITFLSGDFFRASFDMPSAVPMGEYDVQAFLFRDGRLVARRDTTLRVTQVGIGARLFLFAYNQGLAYGLCAVLFALGAGWAAWVFMRRE